MLEQQLRKRIIVSFLRITRICLVPESTGEERKMEMIFLPFVSALKSVKENQL